LLILILLTGCVTFGKSNEKWPLPRKPKIKDVSIISSKEADIHDDGFYISKDDAINLADNVDELKAYIKKLELLIKEMKKHYEAQ
jgi:hypothetical protein